MRGALVLPSLAVIAAALVAQVAAAAAVKFIETTWTTDSPDCAVKSIRFFDFNRAVVYADRIGSDSATWNYDEPVLHIYFDNWNANLDGQILGGNEFQALYVWRDEETLKQHFVPCTYRSH
jgi:hypothetical protein